MPCWGVAERQQFNVTLPPELIKKIKYRAIDDQLSASHLVEHLLAAHFNHKEPVMALTLQPMVHVEDMAASVSFYEALGAQLLHGSRDGDFALLQIGSSQLTLLAHPRNPEQHEGSVELNFQSPDDLKQVETRLRAARVAITQPVTDEGFGRQLQVSSPDGLLIKINELQPDLYR